MLFQKECNEATAFISNNINPPNRGIVKFNNRCSFQLLTLNHKVFDYSVKFTPLVAKSFLEAVKKNKIALVFMYQSGMS